jgi:hypothetical protein
METFGVCEHGTSPTKSGARLSSSLAPFPGDAVEWRPAWLNACLTDPTRASSPGPSIPEVLKRCAACRVPPFGLKHSYRGSSVSPCLEGILP